MRLLLTSDWQCDTNNLDLCEQSLQELLAAAKKYKPDAIIHAGDVKDAYSPVHVPVVSFAVRAVRRICEAGHRLIILLGNHDRVSQTADSKNWLDVLRVAGAETVSKPRSKRIGDGVVSFLPYTSDKKEERRWAAQLAAEETTGLRVLIFHTEVKGAVLNGAGIPTSGADLDALGASHYTACFGGHIHGHQQIGKNAWYIGSPFCQDWSEANACKGHVLADIEQVANTGRAMLETHVNVSQLVTKIPHWYDAEWLIENNQLPEPGAYIRSKVDVASKKIKDQLQDAEQRLRATFGDSVKLFVIPQITKQEAEAVLLQDSSDTDNVARYVAATFPVDSRCSAKVLTSYLSTKLGELRGASGNSHTRFIKAWARNVLTFKKVKIPLANQGLVLLSGKNLDWPKRSNGAGKTNCLSLLGPVPLFGQTIKEQKNDAWACESNEDEAFSALLMKDMAGRKILVERARRPHAIRLYVNGKDQSAGLTGKRKRETQGLIEEAIGLDLKLLLNSVYIDQTIANGFLFAAQQERMDLVGKLLDLERFDTALHSVAHDAKCNELARAAATEKLEALTSSIEELKEQLVDATALVKRDWETQAKTARKEVHQLVKARGALLDLKSSYDDKQAELDSLRHVVLDQTRRVSDVRGELRSWGMQLSRAEKLLKAKKCAVCEQDATGAGAELQKNAKSNLKEATATLALAEKALAGLEANEDKLDKYISRWTAQVDKLEVQLDSARSVLEQAQTGAEREAKQNAAALDRKASVQKKLSKVKRIQSAVHSTIKALSIDAELLLLARKAFSRSGMPAYLSSGLCPVLNQAAEEYAELLFNSRLKIHFEVVDGKFIVDVVNSAGSGEVAGQSVGESAMAGLITAFAIRECAPKTNLLILDEPGHGLDSEGAKQFANGLLKLCDRFETILLTTHNPAIESVLSGQRVWTVEKKDRISRLIT